jgi:MraZ protein
MLSQTIPSSSGFTGTGARFESERFEAFQLSGRDRVSDSRLRWDLGLSAYFGADLGSLRLAFHQPAGRKGQGVDSRFISVGAGERRIRGTVHPALEQPAFDCGGHALLREIDGFLEVYSPYSQEREMFSTALLGTSEILKVDSEGRVFLTESIKHHAFIASEVTFVGLGHKFRIWEPERFRAHLDEARNRMRDMRKQIGARHAAEEPRVHGARE